MMTKKSSKKLKWRQNVPTGWQGSRQDQFKVPGMRFSSLLQVPPSKGSRLIRMLSKAEPRIAKSSNYQVKLVKKSGKPLSHFFNKNLSKSKCHRKCCAVCSYLENPKNTTCGIKSVVYLGECVLCRVSHKANPVSPQRGIYVGQTYRTLAERAAEHRKAYRDLEDESFMFKHWVLDHNDLVDPPKFEFKVVRHQRILCLE